MKGCLARLGENVTSIQPSNPMFHVHSEAELAKQGQSAAPAAYRDDMLDYANESFEVASYEALRTLAQHSGDQDTARVAEQILRDEREMVRWLDEKISGNGHFSQQMPGEAGTASIGAPKMAETTTAEQTNLRTVRASYDALNAHDMDRFSGFYTDDFRGEAPGTTHALTQRENRQYVENYLKAFPDLHFELTRVLAQGDLVVADWTGTGTHNGPLQAPDGSTIPPGHKKVVVYGSNTFKLENDKIKRAWIYYDMNTLMQQMGLTKGPQAQS